MTESWCGSSTHISQSNWLMPVWLKIFAIASDVKNGIRWLPPRFDRPSGRPIWPKWNAGSPSATRLSGKAPSTPASERVLWVVVWLIAVFG